MPRLWSRRPLYVHNIISGRLLGYFWNCSHKIFLLELLLTEAKLGLHSAKTHIIHNSVLANPHTLWHRWVLNLSVHKWSIWARVLEWKTNIIKKYMKGLSQSMVHCKHLITLLLSMHHTSVLWINVQYPHTTIIDRRAYKKIMGEMLVLSCLWISP